MAKNNWERIFNLNADKLVSVTVEGELKAFLQGFEKAKEIDYKEGDCAVSVDGFFGGLFAWRPLTVFHVPNSRTKVLVYAKRGYHGF